MEEMEPTYTCGCDLPKPCRRRSYKLNRRHFITLARQCARQWEHCNEGYRRRDTAVSISDPNEARAKSGANSLALSITGCAILFRAWSRIMPKQLPESVSPHNFLHQKRSSRPAIVQVNTHFHRDFAPISSNKTDISTSKDQPRSSPHRPL
jgi:hypothetical protein